MTKVYQIKLMSSSGGVGVLKEYTTLEEALSAVNSHIDNLTAATIHEVVDGIPVHWYGVTLPTGKIGASGPIVRSKDS